MAGTNPWVAGARVRTQPAAVVPVVVGTAVASAEGSVVWWRAIAALVVALAIQVGTNYANDYHDGIRGTDDHRVGPVRLVAGGLASPASVKRAAILSFAVAAVAGLALAAAVSWWLILVGALSFAAGWLYTGGSHPYGYAGFGELFVFVFFGLVATVGSAYVHLERITGLALLASVPVGLLATGLLVVNNLRDIPTDAVTGKHTLAVRVGAARTRMLYAVCVIAPVVLAVAIAIARPGALLAVVAVLFAVGPMRRVLRGDEGRDLVAVLQQTGRLQLVYGVLLAVGIAL
jgi:1,4-dihydroxy-2-naphthoate octaprenyltransferase